LLQVGGGIPTVTEPVQAHSQEHLQELTSLNQPIETATSTNLDPTLLPADHKISSLDIEPTILSPQPTELFESEALYANKELPLLEAQPSKIPRLMTPEPESFLPPPPGIPASNWKQNWISFKKLK
jgi:hypothetical protein